jgi:septum formation protein
LALLQIPFEVVEPTMEEHVRPGLSAMEQARLFAEAKVCAVEGSCPDNVILASDTLIAVDGETLGKPVSRQEAMRMLERLSGRDHLIYTAVTLACPAARRRHTEIETVRVWFRAISAEQIEDYILGGESMGKAGAYAIQGEGGRLVERVEGDYTAVVGLPLGLTAALLWIEGIDVMESVEKLYRSRPYPNWERFMPDGS